MSTKAEEVAVAADTCCASCGSCGVAAIDVKLKDCDNCDLLKYCRDKYQEIHRLQHKKMRKKRLAELRNKELFEQPDGNHLGECPICCLPLPIDESKSIMMTCCSKLICNGCNIANQVREISAGLKYRCVFCREPLPDTQEESFKQGMKRVKENNDPDAMCHMGKKHGIEGDYEPAFKYWTKAAEMGDAVAHYNLSAMYDRGLGVEEDAEKEMYHLEEAAIAGHPEARYNLGCKQANNGRFERAKKHFIIAANLGHEDSLKELRELFVIGHASKEDYASALRVYQAAVKATKSHDREAAEAYYEGTSSLQRFLSSCSSEIVGAREASSLLKLFVRETK